MNWLSWALKIFSLAPFVIQEVERIHGELPGASKKQLAMDSLSAATNVALSLAPAEQQPAVQAASTLASSVIDGTVALLNATGAMPSSQKQKPDPTAIAAAATSAASAAPATAAVSADTTAGSNAQVPAHLAEH